MSKHHVRKMSAVLASVFAHTGHITKDEAKEISGLEDSAFEEAFEKAGRVADKFIEAKSAKMDRFAEHFGKEIEEYVHEVVGHLSR